MNREVLIKSLEEFMSETDARLTALEAAKPQAPAASCDEMLDMLLLSNADKRAAIANLIAENKRLEERYNNLLNSPMPGAEAPKPNERDWEAAANSALSQLTFARKNAGWLRDTLDTAQDKIERLLAENRRLTDGFYALEAQRNTLAAQVDDLRNVNAGLRKHNASQQDLLVSGRLRSLRRIEALLAVEWVTGECPWCGNSHREGHEEDCPRQAALR